MTARLVRRPARGSHFLAGAGAVVLVIASLFGTASVAHGSDELTGYERELPPAEPEGELEPWLEPEPTGVPEPSSVPEPSTVPEPTAEPEPSTVPDPSTEPEPSTVPDPSTEPEPTAQPEPTPQAEPTTQPEPTALPEPIPVPVPTPAIVPSDAAEPIPAPETSPAPVVESPSAEPISADLSALDGEVSVDRTGLKPGLVAQTETRMIAAGTSYWADVPSTSTGPAWRDDSHAPFAQLPSGHSGSAAAVEPSGTVGGSETVVAGPEATMAANPVVDRSRGPSGWTEHVNVRVPAEAVSGSIVALAAPRVPSAVTVAVDFGRAGNGWAGAIVFNLWLRRMLRQRRMSQRQLAYLSGVDHSTISRLVAGERTPSLATATKLAQALRLDPAETAASLGLVADNRVLFPMQRVEAALRGDEDLEDDDIRALMDEYLMRRARRRRAREGPSSASEGSPVLPMTQNAAPPSSEPHRDAIGDSSKRR